MTWSFFFGRLCAVPLRFFPLSLPFSRPFFLSLALAFSLSFVLVLSFSTRGFAWSGVVVRVLDGDTVLVAPAGVTDAEMSVRLYGIDAPEVRQKGGKASREALKAMLKPGDTVEVVSVNADRYHRAAALLVYKGRILNLEMLKQGQAWLYTKYCKASFCRKWHKAEQVAAENKTGLWDEANPLPPWQWRKERGESERKHSNEIKTPVQSRDKGRSENGKKL